MNEDSHLDAAYEDRTHIEDSDFDLNDHPDIDNDEPVEPDEPNDSMDGDHDSAMASAGFGTDEDYGGGCEYL